MRMPSAACAIPTGEVKSDPQAVASARSSGILAAWNMRLRRMGNSAMRYVTNGNKLCRLNCDIARAGWLNYGKAGSANGKAA